MVPTDNNDIILDVVIVEYQNVTPQGLDDFFIVERYIIPPTTYSNREQITLLCTQENMY